MTIQMVFVLIMIIAMFGGLVFELARPDMVVFSVLVIFLITGILTPEEAVSGFSNQGMLTIAFLFIVAGAVQKSGLIDLAIKSWLSRSQTQTSTMLRFFLPIALLSAFLNNTPIVVTFTPIIKKWCEDRGLAPSKFLIPLSYVTILGGTLTLIGTSTNLVIQGLLLQNGIKGFSLFTITLVGIPVALIGLLYIFTVGIRLLPEHKGFREQVQENTKEFIAEMKVSPTFPYLNKTVEQAGLRDLKGLYLIEIIRGPEHITPVKSTTTIMDDDRLIFTGLISTIVDLQKIPGLSLETGTHLELEDLKNDTVNLVEAVVSHQSSLLSKTIKQSKFRSRYDAGVIAVHRNNERLNNKVGDIKLRPGDTLLLIAGSDFIEKYNQSNDFYVVSNLEKPDNLKQSRIKGILSLVIFACLIALVTAGVLSMFKAMAMAVLLNVFFKIVSVAEAKSSIQFDVLLLIASSFGIGNAMTQTGLSKLFAGGLMHVGESFGLFSILIILFLMTSLFTELITNSAAAVLMLPIALDMANLLHLPVMGFAVLIAIAASASFITPIGYQTNLIVYGPGGYKFWDYVKIGLPLTFLVMITSVTAIYWIWF